MDLRSGNTYETYEAARGAGVPASDIAHVVHGPDGEPRPSFQPPPKWKFTKGSFKRVPVVTHK